MKKPLIAIVGRPNTGKSTFFNKVAGKRISIVKNEAGVTRDRIYADATWLNYQFTLVDTGGIDLKNKSNIQKNITMQAKIAIDLADVILLFVDGVEGYTEADAEVASMLRKSNKPVYVCVNKVDNLALEDSIYDFYQLGLTNVYAISAEQSKGIGDLLDDVCSNFDKINFDEENESKIKIAIVGKPNAGKSSITNRLLGEERVVVSDVAGTTRDAIDTPFEYEGEQYICIDTAGMRRKRGIELESVEQYSVIRALEAIRRADVVLCVVDSQEGLTEQDLKIIGYVHEQGKPSIIVMNKWDLIEKDTYTILEFEKKLKDELNFMSYFESVYVSCLTGQRIAKIMPIVKQVYENSTKKLKTSVLNEVLQDAVSMTQPPSKNGKRLKFYYVAQTGTQPPKFTIQVNDALLMHFSYERYLENCFRRSFDFKGTPIKFEFKSKPKKEI